MSKSDAAESDLLKLLFNNTTWAGVGDTTGIVGSGGAGSLYVSLHTADPGDPGNQTTSEATYTNYARVAVARSGAGWTVSGTSPTQAANAALVSFPQSGGTANTLTFFGIGKSSSGAGELLYSGPLSASLIVNNLETPEFPIGTLIVTED